MEDGCPTGTCCRCGKGPDVCWLGAYRLGPHTICVDCYHAIETEFQCDRRDR